jgi:hypothetical protein
METTLIKPGEIDEVNGNKYDENIEITLPKQKAIIKRELKGSGYRWEMRGNRFVVIDTKKSIEIVLTKVGAMSLMKFLPNYLDKMRIEDNKSLRAKIQLIRTSNKAKKEKHQHMLFARGRTVK